MTASPADIARFTSDGVVIISRDAAVLAAHPDARSTGSDVRDSLFTNPAHAQIMSNEKFAILKKVGPANEAIELEETFGLGSTIPIAPTVPCFRIVDEERGLDVVARTSTYAFQLATDRFAVGVRE